MSRRILVIDDDEIVLRLIQRCLGSEYALTTVTCGSEALDLLARQEPYDVVLCDLLLADMAGEQLYEELLDFHPAQARRMALMTSGRDLPEFRDFIRRFDGCLLAKPFEVSELRRTVEVVLSRAALRDSPRP